MEILLRYLLLLLSGLPLYLSAQIENHQSIQWYESDESIKPLIVLVFPENLQTTTHELILESKNWSKYNSLIVADHLTSIEEFKNTLNNKLNDSRGFDMKRLYLIVIGDQAILNKYQSLNLDLFAALFHIYPADQVIESSNIASASIAKIKLDTVLHQLQQKYLWGADLDLLKKKARTLVHEKKANSGIGLQFGILNYQSNSTDLSIPSTIRTLGLHYYRSIQPHWVLNLDIDASINRPNPQEIFREQVLDQIDLTSFLSGDDIEVDLNATIQGHISTQLGIGINYVFTPQKKIIPYLGVQFSLQNHMLIDEKIDTTLFLEGGSSFDNLQNSGQDDFTPTIFRYFSISPKAGVHLNFNESWFLDLNMQYTIDPNRFRKNQDYLSGILMRVGLHRRLLGKIKVYHEYLR